MVDDLLGMMDEGGPVTLRLGSPALAAAVVPLLRRQLIEVGRPATFQTAAQYVYVTEVTA